MAPKMKPWEARREAEAEMGVRRGTSDVAKAKADVARAIRQFGGNSKAATAAKRKLNILTKKG